ncbi:MAG: signal recognition particle-docking protein FtsY [Neisseriaceae bacterium]
MFKFFRKKKSPEETEKKNSAETSCPELSEVSKQQVNACPNSPLSAENRDPLDSSTTEEVLDLAKEETSMTSPHHTPPPQLKETWGQRLKKGLAKSRDKFNKSLATALGGGQIDESLYEELENVLLLSDMGFQATQRLLEAVRARLTLKGLKDPQQLKLALKEAFLELISPLERELKTHAHQPCVLMMVGINGAGKTTTIGKLAHHFQAAGNSLILGAGDTFRAAAKEQLIAWGQRNNVTVIAQDKGDCAAVCYDTVEAAKARKKDIALLDTAGRLPTQLHLMEEIKKVKRVIQKALPDAPHEIILVLDANIGQNTLNQVIAFDDALQLTGLILTKLDGTAKGGIVAALAQHRPIPILYLGVGEAIEDLKPFKAQDFVEAFFSD